MQQRWQSGQSRNLYQQPPAPQPRGANDISTRLARVEEHLTFSAWNLERIEAESLARGSDLLTVTQALNSKVDNIAETLRDRSRSEEQRREDRSRILTRAKSVGRMIGAMILFGMVLAGKVSIEQIKPFLGLFGFPAG